MNSKTKTILEWTIFSFLGVILILASILLFYQKAYAGKIYRNVYIENISLEGKTKKQAAYIIKDMYDNIISQKIVLRSENREVTTTLADTGLSVDIDEAVNQCYRTGRNENFFKQLLYSAKTITYKNTVKLTPEINNEKYQQFLAIAIDQLNTKPEDASLIIENGQVKEKTETTGAQVKTDNLVQQILSLATAPNKTLNLETITMPSTVKAADFQSAKNYADIILSKNIIFKYDDKQVAPSRNDIGLWISFATTGGQVTASLNDNNLRAYINKVGKPFEVTRRDKKINSLNNQVLDEGQEGKYINKDEAIKNLKAAIDGNQLIEITFTTYTEAPKELRVIPSEGLIPGRFEGKYIDGDLTTQKLCRVEGNNVIDCFPISSGKPGMDTPTGTFTITGKSPRQFSRKYGMWMPWWQQFSGDYGIHELPETDTWKEVPDHLGTPISHGCMRLGVGPAQTVYEWTEIGTPVYIHK